MQAFDVMTSDVISVSVDTEVREIAGLLIEHRISAVPVVGAEDKVLGIVSEGDLMHRVETGTERRSSWWLANLFSGTQSAGEYVKSHGRKAGEIMTPDPVTITEDTPLDEVAKLLEKHHIKRVPVVRDGRLVGIVSRANLLHGLAMAGVSKAQAPSSDDREIRAAIIKELKDNTDVLTDHINVMVSGGEVQLWGLVESKQEKLAVQVAAENINGVMRVENHLGFMPRGGLSGT
ncbi:CBS domain-containing protein [Franzmannia pantelleriensis]|uniref:CBS domain-containing protein n=1 Tax=Franzmannia pantelleriensis TaxID=48727 RepID=A0A1G9G604_9GAMM|nr:CBS domain-containing protein [Halomonas pantelleriensis]SDK96124.1 CBS domain-containing protein [Halomonas pantelleriensis]